MKGSHIEFGDCINSSNYITSNLVNYYRCNGFDCFPEISSCYCALDEYVSKDILFGSPDALPWYDPNDPASTEYLGKLVLRVDGLDSSPMSRQISDTINGSYAERARSNGREAVFDGLMFALTSRGMEYGKRWEREQLWNTFDGCDSNENVARIRFNCEMNLVELRRFSPRSGPTYTSYFSPSRSTSGCCDMVARFEYTVSILDASFYDVNSTELGCIKFDDCDVFSEPWECDVEEPQCGPECCSGCTHNILEGLFDFEDDCCYCRPMFVNRKVIPITLPATGGVGFNIKVFAGDSTFENARILLVDSPDDCALEDFDIWNRVRIIKALEFSRLSAGDVITVDGRAKKVTATTTDCGDIDGRSYVYSAGGLPMQHLDVAAKDVKSKLYMLIEADAFSVDPNATVCVESFLRF